MTPSAELEPVALDELVSGRRRGASRTAARVQLSQRRRRHASAPTPRPASRAGQPDRERARPRAARGHVTVALHADDGRARIIVRDQGRGPDPADRDHLFERFWRGGDAGHRPGSGLGLSIVAAIVDRHGGEISVDGPTFTVALALVP